MPLDLQTTLENTISMTPWHDHGGLAIDNILWQVELVNHAQGNRSTTRLAVVHLPLDQVCLNAVLKWEWCKSRGATLRTRSKTSTQPFESLAFVIFHLNHLQQFSLPPLVLYFTLIDGQNPAPVETVETCDVLKCSYSTCSNIILTIPPSTVCRPIHIPMDQGSLANWSAQLAPAGPPPTTATRSFRPSGKLTPAHTTTLALLLKAGKGEKVYSTYNYITTICILLYHIISNSSIINNNYECRFQVLGHIVYGISLNLRRYYQSYLIVLSIDINYQWYRNLAH